jgi:hypothetical protein
MRNAVKIAIDFDGTIADTNVIKVDWIKKHLGLQVPPWKCDRTSCVPIIGSANYEMMAKFVYGDEGTSTAKPNLGAIQAIKTLTSSFVLYVFTDRRAAHLAFAEKWLMAHSIREFFEAVISSANVEKSNLCLDYGIGVLFDDDLSHLVCCENKNIRAILFKPGPEEINLPDGVFRVKRWSEFVKHISRRAID